MSPFGLIHRIFFQWLGANNYHNTGSCGQSSLFISSFFKKNETKNQPHWFNLIRNFLFRTTPTYHFIELVSHGEIFIFFRKKNETKKISPLYYIYQIIPFLNPQLMWLFQRGSSRVHLSPARLATASRILALSKLELTASLWISNYCSGAQLLPFTQPT